MRDMYSDDNMPNASRVRGEIGGRLKPPYEFYAALSQVEPDGSATARQCPHEHTAECILCNKYDECAYPDRTASLTAVGLPMLLGAGTLAVGFLALLLLLR